MTQALHSAIESINALSLEEKHQLWLILDEAIAQAEEDEWLEDDETTAEIQEVREEYQKGEYIILDENKTVLLLQCKHRRDVYKNR